MWALVVVSGACYVHLAHYTRCPEAALSKGAVVAPGAERLALQAACSFQVHQMAAAPRVHRREGVHLAQDLRCLRCCEVAAAMVPYQGQAQAGDRRVRRGRWVGIRWG
jgi:hypothetical protein